MDAQQILTNIIDAVPMWLGIPILLVVVLIGLAWSLAPNTLSDSSWFRKKSKK